MRFICESQHPIYVPKWKLEIENYDSESLKSSTKLLRWTTFNICFSDLPLILVSLPLALFLSLLLHTPDMVKASWKIIGRHTYGIIPMLMTFCRTVANMLNHMLMLHYSACFSHTSNILSMWCIFYFLFKIILKGITACFRNFVLLFCLTS